MSTIASHSPLNLSETVIDRDLVPKDHHQLEMANGESNGHVTDLMWLCDWWSHDPERSNSTPICLCNILKTAGVAI